MSTISHPSSRAGQTAAALHHAGPPHGSFDASHALHELRHYLPSQAALKDFIHHNSLHAYQNLKFYEGIFKAGAVFGYQVTLQLEEFRELYRNGRIRADILERVIGQKKGPGAVSAYKQYLLEKNHRTAATPRIGALRRYWNTAFQIDLDSLVHPLLFRALGAYFDQGVSLWRFPVEKEGFLASLRQLEQNGVSSWFKTKRAKRLLLEGNANLENLLATTVGDPAYFEQYLFDQQFAHPGWSGFAAVIEEHPESLLDRRQIKLEDLIIFELLLEIDALDARFGEGWSPLCSRVDAHPVDLLAPVPSDELQEALSIWQDAFEWSYYDEVLAGIAQTRIQAPETSASKTFQAIFCIDERECSLRRHIEQVDPNCETLGAPGFFGVEFYFQPENGQFYEKLCPAPVTPKYLIKEYGGGETRPHDRLYTPVAHTLIRGSILSVVMGFWALVRMTQNLFRPAMSPAISNAFAHMNRKGRLGIVNEDPSQQENGLQIGFTVEEMTTRVEGQLRNMGLISDFAPLIYVVAHGSSSANNPHHGAHDCGACSGRPGSVNARVFAFMANHTAVRQNLAAKGIEIPSGTQFVGALHDTAADEIDFFDEDALSAENQTRHRQHKSAFERALDYNAKERSRRFASINTRMPIARVRKAIKDRSVSLFEPRPELGHGTNTLCIVGSRQLTKRLFLDRRAFLNSYDYRTDPEGRLLTGVMRPLGPVCGGINLEYYFSRVDNLKLGAGTKLPHHVQGLYGVTNSSDGDLRPGLPWQMIEVHDPVRLLIIVEHHPDVVLASIQSAPDMYEWYINEWVHLVVIDPATQQFMYFKNGHFTPYKPLKNGLPTTGRFDALVENALEMETIAIADATKENLPVLVLEA